MLSVAFFYSFDMSFGSPCLIRLKSLLSSFCSFSTSSKGISPSSMLLKVRNRPLNLKNLLKEYLNL